jgi:recombination protein RecT
MELKHENQPEAEEESAVTLADHLQSETFKRHLEAILPKHLTSERFGSIAMRQLSLVPELKNCTLRSVIGSMMTAATLGLEIGTQGECFLIPYSRECTLQIGVWGHAALAWRSEQISDLQFDVVMKGDRFDFQKGTDAYLHHIPEEGRDLDATERIEWVYAVARTVAGGKVFDAFDRKWIERIRGRSQAQNSPAWTDFFAEMAMAKALKRVLKLCPKSRECGRAITLDDEAEAGQKQVWEIDTSFLLPSDVATNPKTETTREALRSSRDKPRRQNGPEKAETQADDEGHGLTVEGAEAPEEGPALTDADAPGKLGW